MQSPKAFISYAWESPEHNRWIREFAVRLRQDGVASILDQWETMPGDLLPAFMEKAVRDSDYVLVICTPKYKEKSDKRSGGVGYEGDVMTAEAFTGTSRRKFIPILRTGEWNKSAPSWLQGTYYVDLRGDVLNDEKYKDLLDTLLQQRISAPPIGKLPTHSIDSDESKQANTNKKIDNHLLEMGRRWLLENQGDSNWHQVWQRLIKISPQEVFLRELGTRWLLENQGDPNWHQVWQILTELEEV